MKTRRLTCDSAKLSLHIIDPCKSDKQLNDSKFVLISAFAGQINKNIKSDVERLNMKYSASDLNFEDNKITSSTNSL